MNQFPTLGPHCSYCDGECQNSTCLAHRWNGTSRPAALDEALPNSPDPAWGRNGGWLAFFLVVCAAVVGNIVAQVMR